MKRLKTPCRDTIGEKPEGNSNLLQHLSQTRIQNLAKHLVWSFHVTNLDLQTKV